MILRDSPNFSSSAQRHDSVIARVRARRLSRSRNHQGSAITMNFAPMIDMTFLLLIFFLVTTTFERAEGILASKLPTNTGRHTASLPLVPIVVRVQQVDSDHNAFHISLDGFDAQPTTFTALTAVLLNIQAQPGFDNETPVVIVADQELPWDHVVACWNATLNANCQRVAFGD